MRHALICLLLIYSAKADVLFRDENQGHGNIFESDRKDAAATVSRDDIIESASKWAAGFYDDDFLEVADVESRMNPIRFWLVTLKNAVTDETFYAVVLPDGTMVEPLIETSI